MSFHARLASLLRNTLRHRRVEADLDEEVRAYLDMVADEQRAHGLSEDEARRAARLEVQGIEQLKERVRDVRTGVTFEQFRQDLGYGIRVLSRYRGFTAAAVATLALGIGASTATFSIVDSVVFRQLPYKDTARLVKIWGTTPKSRDVDVSLLDLLDIRSSSSAFERIAADDGRDFEVVFAGTRERVLGALVTADWLHTLGVTPALGRGFLPGEAQAGHDGVVVLTDSYWRRGMAADPAILGKTLTVDGQHATIVGVLPPNVMRYSADFLKPLVAADYVADRAHRDLDAFARLGPGVTIERAQAELNAIARRLATAFPATNTDRGFRLVPLDKSYAGIQRQAGRGLLLMLGAVGMVMLIACVNVANLLLARAVTRARECLIRAAIGASRGRLVRQLLIEHVLLFLAGGACGALLAWWWVDSLRLLAVAGGYVPARMAISVDGRVLGFCLLASLVTGLVFGLAPALQASRVDLAEGLRDASYTVGGGHRPRRARRVLIVAELVLSLVLLIGFGLLVRSFVAVQATGGGFDPQELYVTASDGGRQFGPAIAFWRTALERVAGIPEVETAAVTSRPPMHGVRQKRFVADGPSLIAPGEDGSAGDVLVSADYFRAMRIPILKGRAFTDTDNASAMPVMVVSQSFAHRYFPKGDAIGRRVLLDEQGVLSCCASASPVDGVWREIIGVAGDITQANLDEPPSATMYRPYLQIVEHDMFLAARVRSGFDGPRTAAAIQRALVAIDASKEWWDIRPMERVIDESESIRLRRFVLILLGIFASLALVLAGVGLYGVMAYAVAERRREIAVRVTLGATRAAVVSQVLVEAMRLALVGLLIGCLAAQALMHTISSMLFGITATDPLTYLAVAFALGAIALLASYIPAHRAARMDPVSALRDS